MATCPVCGTPATADDVFCSNCGQRLPQPPAATAGSGGASGAAPIPPMPGPPPTVAPSAAQGPVIPSYEGSQTQSSQGVVITPQSPPNYQAPPSGAPAYAHTPPPTAASQAAAPPKKKLGGCVIAVIVVAVLALCGVAIVGGIALFPTLFPPDPTPTSVPIVPPTVSSSVDDTTPTGTQVPLDVVNASNVSICWLYISPSTSDEWGEDWLDQIGTISPGATERFYLTSGDVVDMQAEDCDGNILDTQYNVSVPPDGLTYTVTGTSSSGPADNTTPTGAEVPLEVVNNSDVTICYLFISPSSSDQWGGDWLEDIGTIEPGFSATFYLSEGEVVDMQIEDCDRNVLDNQYNVTIPPEGLTYTLSP